MEWMLQVIDEVDDAIGAVRHRWSALGAELGAPLVSLLKSVDAKSRGRASEHVFRR